MSQVEQQQSACEAQKECKELQKQQGKLSEGQFNDYYKGKRDMVDAYFAPGYLFDPYLFGAFMDPLIAFSLWDYTPFQNTSHLDWSETDTDISVAAALPGMEKKDINVSVENAKILNINGEFEKKDGDNKNEWWKVGYTRKLTLPDYADVDKADVQMKDGVLNISIPKAKNASSNKTQALQIKG